MQRTHVDLPELILKTLLAIFLCEPYKYCTCSNYYHAATKDETRQQRGVQQADTPPFKCTRVSCVGGRGCTKFPQLPRLLLPLLISQKNKNSGVLTSRVRERAWANIRPRMSCISRDHAYSASLNVYASENCVNCW